MQKGKTNSKKTPAKKGTKTVSKKSAPNRSAFPIRKILVPIDFSKTSVRALRCACRYAEFYKASLVLVHVNPVVLSPDVKHTLTRKENTLLHEKVAQQLAHIHDKEIKHKLPVETVVLNGVPHVEIAKAAKRWKADLIILSTHGHTGFKHVVLGSTAERVVRDAPCPVLTLHQSLLEKRGVKFGPEQMKKILVPTDFSPASKATVRRAVDFAKQVKAKVELLNVVEPLVYPDYPEFGYVDVQLLTDQLTNNSKTQLEKLKSDARNAGVISKTIVADGIPFKEATAYAEKSKANLIVCSTHGRSGLLGSLLGSTAERIVQHAHCPVLVLRQK